MHENCELEVLYCEISEMRRKTEGLSQNQTKTRRHLKDWVPMGKRLEKITRKERFSKKEDWERLIPERFRQKDEEGKKTSFRKVEFTREMAKEKGAKTARWSSLLIWILLKMQIIEITEVKGKSKVYELKIEN